MGQLLAGTSGFSYPAWIPRFYPPGTPASGLLAAYAERLPAVELNVTFRRRPTPAMIRGWLRATPDDFRFTLKAQRGSAIRALLGSPEESVRWLTEPLHEFGSRLGAVLFRVPAEIRRDGPWAARDPSIADRRLRAVLGAWPPSVPLVVELQDPGWHVDETFAALRDAGAVLCTTELQSHDEPPAVRLTGGFLYLRLRRDGYSEAEVDAWASRIEPFLAAGHDAFAFFRHDDAGLAAERAEALMNRLKSQNPRSAPPPGERRASEGSSADVTSDRSIR